MSRGLRGLRGFGSAIAAADQKNVLAWNVKSDLLIPGNSPGDERGLNPATTAARTTSGIYVVAGFSPRSSHSDFPNNAGIFRDIRMFELQFFHISLTKIPRRKSFRSVRRVIFIVHFEPRLIRVSYDRAHFVDSRKNARSYLWLRSRFADRAYSK